jgi:hypothetical protein
MTIPKLSNIPLRDFRIFLESQGLKMIKSSKGRGGHEKWSRSDLDRPITIQTHVDPVPEFIVMQVLRYLGINRKQFFEALNKK